MLSDFFLATHYYIPVVSTVLLDTHVNFIVSISTTWDTVLDYGLLTLLNRVLQILIVRVLIRNFKVFNAFRQLIVLAIIPRWCQTCYQTDTIRDTWLILYSGIWDSIWIPKNRFTFDAFFELLVYVSLIFRPLLLGYHPVKYLVVI